MQIADLFTYYETGLEKLLNQMGPDHQHYPEALTLQQRLVENIAQTRQHGDTEARRAERSEIVLQLNALTQDTLGSSFNELAGLETSFQETPASFATGSPSYTINFHGAVYGLALGDQATATVGATTTHPFTFMAPLLPPQGVFGREDDLGQLYDQLALGNPEATEVPPVALRGMGGIGKTTLAITLARLDFIPRLFPDGVLWATVGLNPTIRLLLDTWGQALGVDLLPERDESACCDRLRNVLYHRRALLVVDDVWEIGHGRYFNVAGPRCRILFTTREKDIAHHFATAERTLRVDVLKPEAALALLHRLAPAVISADEPSARRLCERLEYLPLALTLTGRLLADETDVPQRMQRLLGELLERREARLQLLQAEGRPGLTEEPISLQALLGLSVERLSKPDQERFAMAAVFGGEPLTWDLPAAAHVWECSAEEAEDTIARFIRRGLVERRGERYWMHALLADYANEMLEELGL